MEKAALALLLAVPLMGALLVGLTPRDQTVTTRSLTLIFSLLNLALATYVFLNINNSAGFDLQAPWIPAIGATFHLRVDGLSVLLVTLTAFMIPICIAASWNEIQEQVKEFHICLLLLETMMLGVFMAFDLLLFYLFWEAMLVPMVLLIGIWGTPSRRVYAAVKFLLFTLFGGVLMLAGILVLYVKSGANTFNLALLMEQGTLPQNLQLWLFGAFAIAFAIKVPMFPFHTWLPDAHTEAPTAGSVILAGVLLKMGAYGFLRFCLPLFPDASFILGNFIALLSLIAIIYGACMAWVQTDIKRLIAYSSVSHLGFITLGIFTFNSIAIEGSILHMVNHGLSTGALFLLVGMIYERRHTRRMDDYGGLAKVVPSYSAFFLIALLASVGLPGLNGFVGEWLILLGTFQANWKWAALAASGVILAAVYLLWLWRNVFHGPLDKEANRTLHDLTHRERWAILIPVTLLIFWIGIYPNFFLRKIGATASASLEKIEAAAERHDRIDWPLRTVLGSTDKSSTEANR